MSRPHRIPAQAIALIAALALMLGTSASGSDLHLADPPSDVAKETTVCNERLLDDTELLAKICTTTWRNSTPGGGEWRHAHVSASVKNVSTRQKPYYLNRVEIVSDAGVVKATCLYKAYLKPNQTANCAEGIAINVGLPNMRIHLEWNMYEV
jgi:hypothetical protein